MKKDEKEKVSLVDITRNAIYTIVLAVLATKLGRETWKAIEIYMNR